MRPGSRAPAPCLGAGSVPQGRAASSLQGGCSRSRALAGEGLQEGLQPCGLPPAALQPAPVCQHHSRRITRHVPGPALPCALPASHTRWRGSRRGIAALLEPPVPGFIPDPMLEGLSTSQAGATAVSVLPWSRIHLIQPPPGISAFPGLLQHPSALRWSPGLKVHHAGKRCHD